MSTELIEIKSNNPNFPDDTLTLEEGTGGLKIVLSYPKEGEVHKFWLKPEDLKSMALIARCGPGL